MSEKQRCNLCREDQAMEVDFEKPMYKAVNKLLQRLFECYKIDVSILGESSCICQACFEGVLHISESLRKWSKAQEGLQEKPLEIDDSKAFQETESPQKDVMDIPEDKEETEEEIDDSKAFQVKLENPSSSSEDEEMESPQKDVMGKEEAEEEMEVLGGSEFKPDFFCVAIAQDGMVIAKLFKDKTKTTKLMCTCCDRAYDNLLQIRCHNPLTRKSPTYYCGTCGASFNKPKQLADHEEAENHTKSSTRHRDIDFHCLNCDETFARFSDIIRHDSSCHSSLEYACPSCDMNFKYYGPFQKHLRTHKPVNPPVDMYNCSYPDCTRRFRVWKRYVKHIHWHKALNHKCPYVGCNATTVPGNFMRHLRSHYNQAKFKQEGKFMELDPTQRVHPDVRKVPYARRLVQAQMEEPPVERIKVRPEGEFISLPKRIVFRKGRYVNVFENNE